MNKIWLFSLTLLLVACGGDPHYYTEQELRYYCPDKVKEKVKDYSLGCMEAANPRSDEEPEDWIYICRSDAIKLYCEERTVIITKFNPNGKVRSYDTVVKKEFVEDLDND